MFITIFFPWSSWNRQKVLDEKEAERQRERDTDDIRHSAVVHLVYLKTIIFSFNFSFLISRFI